MSTEATVTRHLQAIPQGIDALLADYTEASVFYTPDGPLHGLAAIRGFFEGFLASSPPELVQAFTVTRLDVHGETAYLLWKAEPFIPLATDTFLVRDGKILVQSFAVLAPRPAAV
jgi:ketosteroid isomerase-like protein